jgi:hypothetical protein
MGFFLDAENNGDRPLTKGYGVPHPMVRDPIFEDGW